jgi:hypothetical protein
MRAMPSLCALILGLAGHGAHAQSAAQGESAPSLLPKPAAALTEPVDDIRGQTNAWFKDCNQGWDAGTHMSRRDYERTCLRMAQERVKFMRDWEKPSADRAKTK